MVQVSVYAFWKCKEKGLGGRGLEQKEEHFKFKE